MREICSRVEPDRIDMTRRNAKGFQPVKESAEVDRSFSWNSRVPQQEYWRPSGLYP